LLTLYGASGVDVEKSDSFSAWANSIAVGDIALTYAYCSKKIALHFPETDYVRQQIGLRGRSTTTLSRVTVKVDRGQGCTTSLGRPMRVDCEPRHERLTMRIKTAALESKLAALLGARQGGARIRTLAGSRRPGSAADNHLLRFFTGLFDAESTQPPPLVLRELEQAIIVSLSPKPASLQSKTGGSAARHSAAPCQARRGVHQANWRAVPSTSWSRLPSAPECCSARSAAPRLHADGVRQTGPAASGPQDAGRAGHPSRPLPMPGFFARPLRTSRGIRRTPSQTIRRSS
jgi:hypothetical protein